MRVIFMGTPEFAVVSLNKIISSSHDVAAVVTIPDKPKGRGQKLKSSPVKQAAVKHGIEVLQPEKLKDEIFIKKLKAYNADVFIVVAFKILPKDVFTIPEYGTVNLHASLLPKYRGAAPINWALINGERESGVTTILIDEKVDTGNMLMQEKVEIHNTMTAGELHDILAEVGSKILVKTLDKMSDGSLKPTLQDNTLATGAPKLDKALCHIDFNKTAGDVYNLIRGLNPYPAAFVYHNGKQIKIFSCTISDLKKKGIPGKVVGKTKTDFSVACNEGVISVREVQLEGKRRMPVRDFFNGYTINIGDSLY